MLKVYLNGEVDNCIFIDCDMNTFIDCCNEGGFFKFKSMSIITRHRALELFSSKKVVTNKYKPIYYVESGLLAINTHFVTYVEPIDTSMFKARVGDKIRIPVEDVSTEMAVAVSIDLEQRFGVVTKVSPNNTLIVTEVK